MTWDPSTTTTIRRSIYIKESAIKALHMRQEMEGGLSVRMCSVIISFGSLFKDIVPDCFSDDEWLDLFLVMPLVEEYLVGEFRDILKKSDDTIKDEYIEELLVKMNGLTRPQWIMMKEANYRYWTARKGGLGASDSLDFVFHGNRN